MNVAILSGLAPSREVDGVCFDVARTIAEHGIGVHLVLAHTRGKPSHQRIGRLAVYRMLSTPVSLSPIQTLLRERAEARRLLSDIMRMENVDVLEAPVSCAPALLSVRAIGSGRETALVLRDEEINAPCAIGSATLAEMARAAADGLVMPGLSAHARIQIYRRAVRNRLSIQRKRGRRAQLEAQSSLIEASPMRGKGVSVADATWAMS